MCDEIYYDPKVETFSSNFEALQKTSYKEARGPERHEERRDVVGRDVFPR